MDDWLKAEKGCFSSMDGVCCMDVVVAAENGSCGEVRVREVVEGMVLAEDDEPGRGLVSSGRVPGGIGLRPGDGPRALDR